MHYALRNGIRTDRSRWISFRRASRFLSFAIITLYPFGSIDRSIPPLSRNLFLLLFLRHFCLFLHIYIYIFCFFESIGQSGKGWSENRGSLFFYKRNVKKRISKRSFYFNRGKLPFRVARRENWWQVESRNSYSNVSLGNNGVRLECRRIDRDKSINEHLGIVF